MRSSFSEMTSISSRRQYGHSTPSVPSRGLSFTSPSSSAVWCDGGVTTSTSEERPWGSFEILEEAPTHKVKRIEVTPGRRLSYQRHRHRAEHWFVVSGVGKVTLDGEEFGVSTGDTVDVAFGAAHRIENVGAGALVFIEVQHGDSFAEDDIERLQDDFGRAG